MLGVKLRALNKEMAIEKIMISANCRYMMPVAPGKKDTGINTAVSTKDVAMTAPESSPIASNASCLGGKPCSIQRNGNGDCRNNGGTPILQKDENHQHY